MQQLGHAGLSVWRADTVLLHAERLNGAAALHEDSSEDAEFATFREAAKRGNLVPLYERIFADQLTPVTAYRCLVAEDDREAPSFLFESVVNGTQTVHAPYTAHATPALLHCEEGMHACMAWQAQLCRSVCCALAVSS